MGHRKAAFQSASTRSAPPSCGHSTSTCDLVYRETTSHLGCLRSVSLFRSTRHADCSALPTGARPTAAGRLELIEEVA